MQLSGTCWEKRVLRLSTEGRGSSTKAGWLLVWGLSYLSRSLHPWKRRSEVKSCAYVSLICWYQIAQWGRVDMVSGQWGEWTSPSSSFAVLSPGCPRLWWINFPDLWELKQWKMEDIEQVDLLNLTFTQHTKDNWVAHFHTMACLSCLQPLYSTLTCGCLSVTRTKICEYELQFDLFFYPSPTGNTSVNNYSKINALLQVLQLLMSLCDSLMSFVAVSGL